jgi:bifunctional UDP-N-acetylglucosamine pyrophosphorylase/glucosamine-1-phosphate N-acetyltransferase
MVKAAAVILAAGEGKRMKSKEPKVLHEVLFKPMIDWVTDAIKVAGIDEICVVAGYAHRKLETHLKASCSIAIQTERLGTGHAVLQAKDFLLKTEPEDVVILCGDAPFIDGEIIDAAYEKHITENNAVTVITTNAKNPFGYGRIVRKDGNVTNIVEEKDATDDEKQITEINSAAYWFKTSSLLVALAELKNDNVQGEYYLTDTIEIISEKGYNCGSFMLEDYGLIAGANDRKQLAALNTYARRIKLDCLYECGVTITDESGVTVGPDVTVGSDTTILPGTILKGKTKIGSFCVIGPNSLIDNCEIANNVVFNASQAYSAKIADYVTVGPFSHLRPNTDLREKVHVGDFVEIKNSVIGEGTKVSHLTYIGDSDIGKKVNFGCGCVTTNYDGIAKHRTKVGDNAFIGCNTNLLAPVEVGESAYTAAGSTITKNIPPYALAVARSRQENIEGWVTLKRPKKD